MSNTIQIDSEIYPKVPQALTTLPFGRYSLTKLGTVDSPKHGESEIKEGAPYTGRITIINRGGGPSIMIGTFPWSGMVTSWVLDAAPHVDGYMVLTTENSRYKLEGPLPECEDKEDRNEEEELE